MLTLKTVPKTGHLGSEQNLTVLDQRHLGGLMVTLQNLYVIPMITKTNVIGTAVVTGTEQPQGFHSRPLQRQYSGDGIASP